MKKFLSVLCVGLLLSSCCASGSQKEEGWLKWLRKQVYMTDQEKAAKQLRETLEKVKKAEGATVVDSYEFEPTEGEKEEFEEGEDERKREADELLEELQAMVGESFDKKEEMEKLSPVDQKMEKRSWLSKEDILDTCRKFIETSKKNRPKNEWISGYELFGKKLFVEKIEIPNNAHIILVGDSHGESGALKNLLAKLQKEGWIDKDDIFKLQDKDGKKLYIVFFGDYLDRGDEGIENLYIAQILYIKNPDQVVPLRGNHEYVQITGRRESKEELELIYKMNDAEIKKVYDTFGYLVGGCFLIWQNTDKRRGIFCSHNTIDPEQNFKPLLDSKDKKFEAEMPLRKVEINGKEVDVSWTKKIGEYSIAYPGSLKAGELSEGVEIAKDPFDIPIQDIRNDLKKEWIFDRTAIGQIFAKNSNLKDLEIVGLLVGHQQGKVDEVLKKGNGVYIAPANVLSGELEDFQWDLDGPEEIFLDFLMNQETKKSLPVTMIFDLFKYNTNEPSKIFNFAKDLNYWRPGIMPVITLELNPDFKKCKFTREIMTQKRQVEMEG